MAPMNVSDAVNARRSVRAFLPDPVSDETIRGLLEIAARAPSGGNLQPWRIFVVNGDSMHRFREHLAAAPPVEEPGYEIYPASLWEPYRTNRFTVGEQLYATLGIPREDKEGRMAQFARNGDFFGAPAALFCYIDKGMGRPQWSDLGMFLQTFMLLAQEAGLDTCPPGVLDRPPERGRQLRRRPRRLAPVLRHGHRPRRPRRPGERPGHRTSAGGRVGGLRLTECCILRHCLR